MPELPEVENVKRSLYDKLKHRQIKHINIINPTNIKYNEEQDFTNRLINGTITDVSRRGKFLVLDVTHHNTDPTVNPNHHEYFIVHLGMTGALLHSKDKDYSRYPNSIANHIFVELELDDQSTLFYTDYRRFGSLRVVSLQEWETAPLTHLKTLREMGPEPFQEDALDQFIQRIRQNRYLDKPIKDVLLDQRVIAGVGNIYASECLFPNNINPFRTVQDLQDEDLTNIFKTLQSILRLSIDLGGTSIKDYVDGDGNSGSFQDHLKVYEQSSCQTCNTQIDKVFIKKRSTYYCPTCQPLPDYITLVEG